METLFKIDGTLDKSYLNLGKEIFNILQPLTLEARPFVILCIGTDRCTGDALGPLIGHNLNDMPLNNFFVYGTLENPVHAKNLSKTIDEIHFKFDNPFVIAIDACLSSISDIGVISVKNSPLFPGLALKKDLPQIGDISITGVVNIGGNFDFLVLQNTRLYTVMLLCNTIANGINYADSLLSKHLKLTPTDKDLFENHLH